MSTDPTTKTLESKASPARWALLLTVLLAPCPGAFLGESRAAGAGVVVDAGAAADESTKPASRSAAARKARSLMDTGKYAPAIDLLVAARKKGEDTFEISELLVECYQQHVAEVSLLRKRGVGKKMKQAMEHSLALRPEDAGARRRLIRFHLNAPALGGGSKAEARRLIREFPDLSAADRLVYEARVDQAEKNPKAAETKLDEALALEPGHGDALIMRGNMQIADKAYDAAIRTFERCIEADPENMGCHYLIGKVAHVAKVQVPKGIASLERFVAAGSDDRPLLAYAHYRLGEIHARSGNVGSARKHLEQAVAINDVDKAKAALKKLR